MGRPDPGARPLPRARRAAAGLEARATAGRRRRAGRRQDGARLAFVHLVGIHRRAVPGLLRASRLGPLKYLVKLRARRACGVRATDRVAVLDALRAASAARRTSAAWTRISVLQPAPAVASALTAFAPTSCMGFRRRCWRWPGFWDARGQLLDIRAVFTSGELLDRRAARALTDRVRRAGVRHLRDLGDQGDRLGVPGGRHACERRRGASRGAG